MTAPTTAGWAVLPKPFGCVTKTANGQQWFYPEGQSPYLDNALECITIYAQAEIDALRAEVAALKEAAQEKALQYLSDNGQWIEETGRLHTELAALKAAQDDQARDAGRLDWLDAQAKAYGFADVHEGNAWEIGGAYRTLRDAIDHERAAAKETP